MTGSANFSQLIDGQLPYFRIDYQLQNSGTVSGFLGASFENIILNVNLAYEAMGLGTIKKNHVLLKKRGSEVFHSGKTICDFDGYAKGVGYVAFDAKSTDADHWTVPRQQLHQFLYLYRGQLQMDRKTARFFYIVEHRTQPRQAWYLVENLARLKLTGRYDFDEADRIPAGLGMLLDYRTKLIQTS